MRLNKLVVVLNYFLKTITAKILQLIGSDHTIIIN